MSLIEKAKRINEIERILLNNRFGFAIKEVEDFLNKTSTKNPDVLKWAIGYIHFNALMMVENAAEDEAVLTDIACERISSEVIREINRRLNEN